MSKRRFFALEKYGAANLITALMLLLFVGCTQQDGARVADNESDRGKRLVGTEAMVSSAHPLASEAGLKMLEQGGNAVDAAVATAFALNVVEPNMSGIGGGGSMLVWNQENEEADYVDFYTAKRADSYKEVNYDQYGEDDFNLLSTGIPGTVDGLLQALERHGTMSREQVMQPAIQYATEGFPVYMTLAQFIRDEEEKLTRYEGAQKTFYPDGEPLDVGETLKQPELARTLKAISESGASAFYEGENAQDIVEVLNDAGNPAAVEDFANYEPQWDKTPLKGSYKGKSILSAPLPQTGMYIIQALSLLEPFNLREIGLPTESAEAFDILTSTMRLTNADRREYVSDPNWEDIPVNELISDEYISARRDSVGMGTAAENVGFGKPSQSVSHNDMGSVSEGMTMASVTNGKTLSSSEKTGGETTHISVIDSEGNAVSLSTTLSHVFGSGAWVNGFILNNSGFDFSYLEEEEDWESSHPYRIRASTISPTIILDENNEVRLVIGAPGGGRIPTAILQNTLYVLEYGLDPYDAVLMPRIFPDYEEPDVEIEKGFDPYVLKNVRDMGYDIQALSEGYARMYLVMQKNGKVIGVADPRHDGEVRGY
ncbi:gamma-glutamyltransferase [Aliifodinibius salipaludis]|uniref:Glutathione hydrolase proenzyme n=1 Tax=Fodinibius salipaludis TaxID=2032627 RepID=A0A2A2GEB7_9BACT|nr:gamma-glutamyltransferase [Aliifodinibius salipaludis]PAU95219.1 gamma-glutamyltransferase [Aliifodinibius salipaludis]